MKFSKWEKWWIELMSSVTVILLIIQLIVDGHA